jgi:hypothetical protein
MLKSYFSIAPYPTPTLTFKIRNVLSNRWTSLALCLQHLQRCGLRVRGLIALLPLITTNSSTKDWLDFKGVTSISTIKSELHHLNVVTASGSYGIIIKYTRVSRRVRKYSKGRLRYKANLTLLRPRCQFGVFWRLLGLCALASGSTGSLRFIGTHNLCLSTLGYVNPSMPSLTTIQDKMLESYMASGKRA